MTSLADLYFHPEPERVLAALRADEPFLRLDDGRILVSRPVDVAALLADRACVTEFPSHRAARRGRRGALADSVARALLSREPPVHTDLRRALADLYAAPAVAGRREYVRQVCRELLADLQPTDDLVRVLAGPLPYRVNCHLVGLTDRELDEVLPWIRRLEAAAHHPDPETIRAANDAVRGFRRYLAELLAAPESLPADSVLRRLTGLLTGSSLDELDVLDNVKALFFAGAEETTALTAGALARALARREAGQPVDPDALVEEIVRRQPPIRHALRWTTEDVTCPSGIVAAGQVVLLSLTSAAHGQLDSTASGPSPRGTLSFGRGRHKCLGEHLARLQAGVAVAELLALPYRVVAVDAGAPLRSTELQGLGTLPVRVDTEPCHGESAVPHPTSARTAQPAAPYRVAEPPEGGANGSR
ncbi:hypothetical protein ABZ570_07700 [Micromonospora sp. NPDC007271]|uniref:cytochrome P450 n=1 Tax=Micromonospora sp. NPDC007271 TaxID=3154587 RepID=UPI0033D9A028